MTTEHKIRIIHQHIACGHRSNDKLCPVALALIQHFGKDVLVGAAYFYFADSLARIPLPREIISWIKNFDRGFKVAPCTFTVNL